MVGGFRRGRNTSFGVSGDPPDESTLREGAVSGIERAPRRPIHRVLGRPVEPVAAPPA